ncbi:helicase HerA-like domain-containing protein [Streptomyces sp. NPDC054884]|uniref:helicase HerA-like domain-containing protein n=1 Tax=Streptomyces sp. ME08-AFT2 TaxID=3028683 RepID=UPI0029B40685|nr:helicase HerA-like domain-containing protein [Streptomyces sp. ME08-AFT2]MDX3308922.1 DUF853 family protein [Streptomyces sp. ME08-AFT2]
MNSGITELGAAVSESTNAGDIAAGYAFSGPALDLGALLWDGKCLPEAAVRIPLPMLNRHGLVAGATGTGKTKTLQLIAEQLSAQGVPVFLADVKGDLSGVSAPGEANDRVRGRAAEVGQKWMATGFPAEFYALGGLGHGVPLRATVTSFGPVLLSKVLQLNRTQEQSLGLIFHYADQKGLELLDLKDLRSVVAFLTSDEGKAELKGIGGLSTATAGVILRSLTAFEAQGMASFFGEPATRPGSCERGAPTPVAATRLRAPESLMGPVDGQALDRAVRESALYGRYAQAVDRESAFEKLSAAAAAQPPGGNTPAARKKAPASAPAPAGAGAGAENDPSVVEQVVGSGIFKSLARSVGTQLGREITRSLFGTTRRRR